MTPTGIRSTPKSTFLVPLLKRELPNISNYTLGQLQNFRIPFPTIFVSLKRVFEITCNTASATPTGTRCIARMVFPGSLLKRELPNITNYIFEQLHNFRILFPAIFVSPAAFSIPCGSTATVTSSCIRATQEFALLGSIFNTELANTYNLPLEQLEIVRMQFPSFCVSPTCVFNTTW